jgi:hypothetical protein
MINDNNNLKQPDYDKQNLDKYDNPIQNDEAQNVTESDERLSGKEAEKARNKADENMKQEKNG